MTKQETSPNSFDRYTPFYGLVLFAVLFVFFIAQADSIMLVLGGAAGIIFGYFWLLALRVRQRKWRNFLSVLIAPLISYALFALLTLVGVAPPAMKFAVMRPYYAYIVGERKYVVLESEEYGMFLGGGWLEQIIYDETDTIWVDEMRRAKWREENGKSICGPSPTSDARAKTCVQDSDVEQLGGHYYRQLDNY